MKFQALMKVGLWLSATAMILLLIFMVQSAGNHIAIGNFLQLADCGGGPPPGGGGNS